jgi:transcriptional antiterminator NusG
MEKLWYVIQTYVGYEHRVKAALERKIRESGKEDLFGEVLVPTERVVDLVRGKRQTVEQRLFPGYLLVQIVLNEEAWHLVHSVPRLVGFLGEGNTPAVLPEEEVQKIVHQIESGKGTPRLKVLFAIGEKVRVVDGPFRDFTGTVEAVRPDRSRIRLSISVFGRPTPVELDFIQVGAA